MLPAGLTKERIKPYHLYCLQFVVVKYDFCIDVIVLTRGVFDKFLFRAK